MGDAFPIKSMIRGGYFKYYRIQWPGVLDALISSNRSIQHRVQESPQQCPVIRNMTARNVIRPLFILHLQIPGLSSIQRGLGFVRVVHGAHVEVFFWC